MQENDFSSPDLKTPKYIHIFSRILKWTTEQLSTEGKTHCRFLCQKVNTLSMLYTQMYSINILIKGNKQ